MGLPPICSDADFMEAQQIAARLLTYQNPPKPPHRERYAATLEEIGLILGVSAETVRKIEQRALDKARRWCERNGYRLDHLIRR